MTQKIKNTYKFSPLVLFMLLIISGYSQPKNITGTITDSNDGAGIPGVNIILKGTTTGTVSNIDGQFSIVAPSSESVLLISFIGYSPKEIPVKNQSIVDVTLHPITEGIDEVVVIGYGTIKKSDLTGAVSSVSADELSKKAVTNVNQALQGKASGVWISSTSGEPGDETKVRIRGVSSLNRSDPLYVIDGIPVSTQSATYSDDVKYTASLNSINPADIESIEVLKDASATAIYGSRGANGVIIVTTKKGKKGTPKVNFNYYKSLSSLPKFHEVMNTNQFVSFYTDLLTKGTLTGSPSLISGTEKPISSYYTDLVDLSIDNNWQKIVSQTAQTDNFYLSVSGANDYSNYSFSMGYHSQEGTVVNKNLDRINMRVNSDHKIGTRIRIGESLNVSNINTTGSSASLSSAARNAPFMPVYDNLNIGGYAGPYFTSTGRNEVSNTFAEVNLLDQTDIQSRILANVYAELEIIKGLKYKISASTDYVTMNNRSYNPMYNLGADGNPGIRDNQLASLVESNRLTTRLILENILTYQKSINKHSITLLAGHAAESFYTKEVQASGTTFPNPEITIPSGATENITINGSIYEEKLLSYFGRAIYSYDSKYLLTASIRRDGSSRFGTNNQFGIFPSFSLGWKISEEEFFKNVPSINDLKLRVGWGQTGNQDGIKKFYPYFSGINTDRTFYTFGTNQATNYGGTPFFDSSNPDIKWETIDQTNIGIDVGILKNSLTFSIDYYLKKTKDMLLSVPLSYHSGLLQGSAEPIQNIGRIDNKGFEFTFSYKNNISDLQYSIGGNLTTIKNETIQLAGTDVEHIYDDNVVMITTEGMPMSSFYGYISEGLFQSEEEVLSHALQTGNTKPGDVKFKDLDGDHKITANDRTFIGKSIPGLIYGLNFDLNYKQFDLNAFFQGVANVQRYNSTRSYLTIPSNLGNSIDENKSPEVLNYWSESNTETNIPRISETDPNDNARFSSRWIENAGFLRLNNLQLGYTLPNSISSKVKIERIRIYTSFQNIVTITNYSGLDPEGSAVDEGSYPPPRIITFGINIDL